MGRSILSVGLVLVAAACVACGGGSTPTSPSMNMQPAMTGAGGGQPDGMPAAGNAVAAPVGLTGVIRGLNTGARTFSLQTRAATYAIRTDDQTQVWNKGARVRLSSLRDGQSVGIRGYDYTRYVLARSIGVN